MISRSFAIIDFGIYCYGYTVHFIKRVFIPIGLKRLHQRINYISGRCILTPSVLVRLLSSSFKVLLTKHWSCGTCTLERCLDFLLPTTWNVLSCWVSSCLWISWHLVVVGIEILRTWVSTLLYFFIHKSLIKLVVSHMLISLSLRSCLGCSFHSRKTHSGTYICISCIFLSLRWAILEIDHLVIVASSLIYRTWRTHCPGLSHICISSSMIVVPLQ